MHLHGFPSPDPTWTFAALHILPLRTVIGLHLAHETIERSGVRDGLEIDLVTHDVGMFFGMLLKKNGYILEQVLSPLILRTSPEHEELRDIAAKCVTKRHVHHYFGFAETQRKLFAKGERPNVKPLLSLYRVLLTGIHLMRTGEVEGEPRAAERDGPAPLHFRPDRPQDGGAVAEGGSGSRGSAVSRAGVRAPSHDELQRAFDGSHLPETPSKETAAALNDLLVRIRLAAR